MADAELAAARDRVRRAEREALERAEALCREAHDLLARARAEAAGIREEAATLDELRAALDATRKERDQALDDVHAMAALAEAVERDRVALEAELTSLRAGNSATPPA